MATLSRNAPDDARKGRPTLSLRTWRPRNGSDLAGEHFEDSEQFDDDQRFERWLYAERNKWDIKRHTSGSYLPNRLLKGDEANEKLARLLRDQMAGRRS